MTNLNMDFRSRVASEPRFSLTCTNNSTTNWIFYLYQGIPQQPSDCFSLVWFASPYKITPGSKITFVWETDYSFVWANTGPLQQGVIFNTSQTVQCNPDGNNVTTFSMDDNVPQFSPPVPEGQSGTLTIHEAGNIPNNVFSTGIGMSGQATFASQAIINMTQIYTPSNPQYFVAAGNSEHMGQVLGGTVNMSKEVAFPVNVFNMYATLEENNTWNISQFPA